MSDILSTAHPEPDSTFRLENPRKLPTIYTFKTYLHLAKAEANVKIFFDVCRLCFVFFFVLACSLIVFFCPPPFACYE